MVDAQRGVGRGEAGHGRQRYLTGDGYRAVRRRRARYADINLFQGFRTLPVFGRQFHYYMVLIERIIDRRNLALSEGVVEAGVYHGLGDAIAQSHFPVHHQADLLPLVLLIGIDVIQLR